MQRRPRSAPRWPTPFTREEAWAVCHSIWTTWPYAIVTIKEANGERRIIHKPTADPVHMGRGQPVVSPAPGIRAADG